MLHFIFFQGLITLFSNVCKQQKDFYPCWLPTLTLISLLHVNDGVSLQPFAPICELCSTQKPEDARTKYKIWSCKFCTLENSVKLDKCSACGQWRYSHGPPASVQAPNRGT